MAQRGRGVPLGPRAHAALTAFGSRPTGRRHPLVAIAMVVPLAVALALHFGGVQAVMAQASSVAGMLGP